MDALSGTNSGDIIVNENEYLVQSKGYDTGLVPSAFLSTNVRASLEKKNE